MALTNQPYLPLYVDDWMNNNKLKMCSLQAHGLMILIMSIMHKEPTYGKLLLKQRFKQSDNQNENFASQIARMSTFDSAEIKNPLSELLQEKILIIEDDVLICSRMVKDAEISQKRANAGKNGGTSNKDKNFAYANNKAKPKANTKPKGKAKSEANTVNVNGDVNVIENINESESEVISGNDGLEEKPKINCEEVVKIFNAVCHRLPEVQKLTPQRKISIKNRVAENGLSGLGTVFQLVAESNFLNGENERGWTADFDWIMKPANFIKISEGHYKNKNGKQKSTSEQFHDAYNSEAARNFKFS